MPPSPVVRCLMAWVLNTQMFPDSSEPILRPFHSAPMA